MKNMRIPFRRSRGWLAAVIGVLGIIGGARQQVWASSIELPQPTEFGVTAGSAGILPARLNDPESATRLLSK
jgi:hypothetical protein